MSRRTISLIVAKVKSRFECVSTEDQEISAIDRTVQAHTLYLNQVATHMLGGWSINGSDSNCLSVMQCASFAYENEITVMQW